MSAYGESHTGLGQAGKPYMQIEAVRWDSPHFQTGLRAAPTPSLKCYMRFLYIQWSSDPPLLTPLPLYGASLTPAIKSRSGGNSFLMYKPGQGWFPIALHIANETPGLQVKWPHVMDYCTLWRKAELALLRHFQLPLTCFHDDPMFRAGWMAGEESDSLRKRSRKQRGKICAEKKRKWDHIVAGSADVMDMEAMPERTRELADTGAEQLARDLADSDGESSGIEPVHSMSCMARIEEDAGEDADDDEASVRSDDGQWRHWDFIALEWALTPDGEHLLTVRDRPETHCRSETIRLTSRQKGVLRSAELQRMESQCSICRVGMCPPSIKRCPRCKIHWVHRYCVPLGLNHSGGTNYFCSGCKSAFKGPWEMPDTPCGECGCDVVDHDSSVRCSKCWRSWHVLCLVAGNPTTHAGLLPTHFQREDVRAEPWSCRGCQPRMDSLPLEPEAALPQVVLPLSVRAGRILVALDQDFALRLSPDHAYMKCRWSKEPFTRCQKSHREAEQLTRAQWGEASPHLGVLTLLRKAKDVHILSLFSGVTLGCQMLCFVIFGQTVKGGPPVILLQCVQRMLRSKGLGTWALQFLYQLCTKSRELLVKNYPLDGHMGFYQRLGFLPSKAGVESREEDRRYPGVGRGILKRSPHLGAFVGLSLAEVTSMSVRQAAPPTGQWICPAGVGFTTQIGSNSCFAHALLQMILGVPQLVAFLATHEGPADGLGQLVSRCLGHLWSKEQDIDGPALVELLRRRASGQFGQNAYYGIREGPAAGGYLGQQDPSELWDAIFQDVIEQSALELGTEEGAMPVDQLHPFAALMVTQSINVRTCRSCGSEQRLLETATAWRLPIQEQPVTTLAGLLNPMLTDFSSDTAPLPGCITRGCNGGEVRGKLYPVVLPSVLRMEVTRATYDSRRGCGVRSMHRVDLPLHFTTTTAQYDSSNVTYYLRMVLFNVGGESSEAGHYTSGRLRGRVVELCSQRPGGVKLTDHHLTSNEFLIVEALTPRLPKGSVVVGAWYSEQMDGETRVPNDDEYSRHLHMPCEGLPRVRDEDRPSWYHAGLAAGSRHPIFREGLWVSDQSSLTMRLLDLRCTRDSTPARAAERPRRPLREKTLTGFEETIAVLETLVPRQPCLEVPWESDSQEAHRGLLREALTAAELSYTPCFFWLSSDAVVNLGFEEALQQPKVMRLHRQSASTNGRGGLMSLGEALDYTRRQRGPVDPLVSVNATAKGIYSFRGAPAYLSELKQQLGQEVTGGAGILVSGCGAETKFHLHNMPVLVHILATAHQDTTRQPSMVFTYPNNGGSFPMRKRYLLFDTATLERVGIGCYDSEEVQSLLSIVLRIQALSPEGRRGIRWFDGTLDGTRCNAMYFPATMLHHVTTSAANERFDRVLFIGLATEVLPVAAEARSCILERLQQPSPKNPSGSCISELRHIKRQSTSDFTLRLLQELTSGRIQSVTQSLSWFEAEDLRRVQELRTQAYQHMRQQQWSQAESLLLASQTALEHLQQHEPELAAQARKERQAVSDMLLATGADRTRMEREINVMLESVGYHAGKT